MLYCNFTARVFVQLKKWTDIFQFFDLKLDKKSHQVGYYTRVVHTLLALHQLSRTFVPIATAHLYRARYSLGTHVLRRASSTHTK